VCLTARKTGANHVLAAGGQRVVSAAYEDCHGSERYDQRGNGGDEPEIAAPDAPPEALALCRHR